MGGGDEHRATCLRNVPCPSARHACRSSCATPPHPPHARAHLSCSSDVQSAPAHAIHYDALPSQSQFPPNTHTLKCCCHACRMHYVQEQPRPMSAALKPVPAAASPAAAAAALGLSPAAAAAALALASTADAAPSAPAAAPPAPPVATSMLRPLGLAVGPEPGGAWGLPSTPGTISSPKGEGRAFASAVLHDGCRDASTAGAAATSCSGSAAGAPIGAPPHPAAVIQRPSSES